MSVESAGTTRPIMLGGEPASDAIRDFLPLAAELVDHFARTNPLYKSFDMESVHGDLVAVTAQGLRLTVHLLDHRQPPTDRQLQSIQTLTVRQAHAGVPLSAILALTDEGIAAFRTTIVRRAGDEDVESLHDLNQLLFTLTQRLHTLVSVSYLDAMPTGPQEEPRCTGALVQALLSGEDPMPIAHRLGIDIAPRYLVLRLNIPLPRRPGAGPAAHQRVQAFRDLTAATDHVAAHYGAGTLEAPTAQRGLLLIEGAPDWDSVSEAVGLARDAVGVPISAIGETAAVAEVPAASVRTRELAQLVQRLGMPPRLYRMQDLALEYQLTRPGVGRDSLIDLIKPLDNHPELLETLGIHLANDQNRQRTASTLNLHTNTVDNRIKRIAQLTGLDPTLPSGLIRLSAAMIALHVAGGCTDRRPDTL